MNIFPELFPFETQIYELLRVMKDEGDKVNQDTVNGYADLVGKYSQTINQALKRYHTITDRTQKLHSKARLKYAYDFLQILIELLKCFEKTSLFNSTLHDVICDLYTKQDDLLETQYFIAAKQELDAFNNPQIRIALERDLAKKFFQKFQ